MVPTGFVSPGVALLPTGLMFPPKHVLRRIVHETPPVVPDDPDYLAAPRSSSLKIEKLKRRILYFTADARLVEGARTYHFFLLAIARAVTSVKVYFRCKCSD
jgi:hypothetical protein